MAESKGLTRRADGRGSLQGATQDVVRRHNLAALLGHVHRYGPTSRAELTRRLALNRSTIAALVDDLSGRGLVWEAGVTSRTSPGRPSNVVSVRTDTVAALAVVLGVDAVTVAIASPGGQINDRVEVPLEDHPAREFDTVIATVAGSVRTLVSRLGPGIDLVGVGVAVPGVVRRHDGLVHFAPNLGWREQPLGARLVTAVEAGVGRALPVSCRNDAGLGAWAEHIRGIGAGVANLVYLHAEVGVGGGIIADGRLLEGSAGYSGEVGHLRLNPEGAPCRCGSRGCWETEVGEDALVMLAGRRPGGRAVVQE
ncbi:MAG: ROK family transcriptional regulator, partial [Actinomycetes bacterium]